MPRTIVRAEREIDDILNWAMSAADEGHSQFPGMSYEEGVSAAIQWITGETDDDPRN